MKLVGMKLLKRTSCHFEVDIDHNWVNYLVNLTNTKRELDTFIEIVWDNLRQILTVMIMVLIEAVWVEIVSEMPEILKWSVANSFLLINFYLEKEALNEGEKQD